MIGLDPMGGFQRFTFGFAELTGGLGFVPMLIGLFALSEGFRQVEIILTAPRVSAVLTNILPTLKDLKGCVSAYLRACPISLIVGITPAIGAIRRPSELRETKRAPKHLSGSGPGSPPGWRRARGENAARAGTFCP
jgi:putative tricarboxylic transport membrane protein